MMGIAKRSSMKFVAMAVALLIAALSNSGVYEARERGRTQERQQKLDRVLRKALQKGERTAQRVIIRTKKGRTGTVAELLQQHGDAVTSGHGLVDALTAVVHAEDLIGLEQHADVESISIDAIVTAGSSLELKALGLSIGINTVGPEENILAATLGLEQVEEDGNGVGIAVIDSGLEESDDLHGGRADTFYDFTRGGRKAKPSDAYGHGTHVATLIAGEGRGSERKQVRLLSGKKLLDARRPYAGVAPEARIISLKVLDRHGAGYTSAVLEAIEFAIANRDRLKIDVINLSLGHPIYEAPATDPLVQAVEAATRAGLVVVASAGNYGLNEETGQVGYAGVTSPGNAPSAITVGALDMNGTSRRDDDAVANYSSRGPTWFSGHVKPDIVAPGHELVAVGAYNGTLYREHPERRVRGQQLERMPRYLRLSGTSMAAGVTSGVVALMIEANRDVSNTPLTSNTIKAILQFTALPLSSADALTQGTGALNAAGAVKLARTIDPSTPVGLWWLTGPLSPSTSIAGSEHIWSQTVLWGNTVVWGNALYEQQIAWANTVVWGATVVWGNTVVWGATDLVWDSPEVWSQTVVWGASAIGTTDGAPIPTAETVVWGATVK